MYITEAIDGLNETTRVINEQIWEKVRSGHDPID